LPFSPATILALRNSNFTDEFCTEFALITKLYLRGKEMEKTRFVSGAATVSLAALFMIFSSVSINAVGFAKPRTIESSMTGGNRLLQLGRPNATAPQVPDILRPSTKEVTLDDLTPQGVVLDAPVDFNGDGKTDFAVVRNTGGGANGQLTWFWALNGSGTTGAINWGINSDWVLTDDFDGDGKDDITVWRPGAGGVAAFYIFQSSTNTARIVQFGQSGDIPTVVGDYDNDGKADPAVFRQGSPSLWFYEGSLNNPGGNVTTVAWGSNTDVPAPGDFDGDGKNDFGIYRNSGTGQLDFWRLLSNGTAMPVIRFGTTADIYAPGDYDGDHKTDIATFRRANGATIWNWVSSIDGSVHSVTWGSGNDFPVQGDYDGDGKTDIAIWRPGVNPGEAAFWAQLSSTGSVLVFQWGTSGDFPVASYNVF